MKLFPLTVLCLLSIFGSAQTLSTADSLNFGNTFEDAASSQDLEIINTGSYAIEVVDVDLFEIYGGEPFSVSDTAFVLFPKDTFMLNVQFLPEHNIFHQMILVIKTKSGFGHKAVVLTGQGRYSNSYYNSTENKSEEALKTALKTRLGQGYTQLSYNVARDNMYATIDNNNGDVECVYTGRVATFNTRSGANANSFNTEHTFPQGFFSQALPMRSDIHHLFPTDVSANSQRGNDPFGVVTGSPNWQNGGSKSGGGTFEPRNVHKGTCARAMMYFVIRYQDYSNHFSGQETILRQWHNQYPPSTADKDRNIAIAAVQNNRNPFVDYPQFEERINSFVSTSSAPSVYDLYYSDDTINVLDATGRLNYEFVVYNNGNEDIELDNFSLSDTSLHLDPTMPADYDLEPGEYASIKFSYNANINYNANLEFDTDITGMWTVIVPIRSGASIGLNETFSSRSAEIYPNPSAGHINISSSEHILELQVFDLTGKEYFKQKETGTKIDLSQLNPGLYIVSLKTSDNQRINKKLIIK